MLAITFDTHKFVKKIKGVGFTDEQAEILTDTVWAAQCVDLSSLATKTDLFEQENRLIILGIGIAMGQIAIIAALVKLLWFFVE